MYPGIFLAVSNLLDLETIIFEKSSYIYQEKF